PAEERLPAINRFWRYGELDPSNNVCFGEGGAGLYSDGKLITRIKSPHITYVLNRLVQFGAPAEIEYLANPHVGSDRIRRVIPRLRQFLLTHGCEIRFNTRVSRLLCSNQGTVEGVEVRAEKFHSRHVILATGHSAEDVLYRLREIGVACEGKSFAVGLRIEHPQNIINQIQYREWANHPKLGAANYRLAHHDAKTGIGIYSFCMCPGGYVLSSGTEQNRIVCNGMSNYRRNSPFANAALVVTLDHPKNFTKNTFGGMDFRRELEARAWSAVQAAGGGRQLPVQRVSDFWAGRSGRQPLPGSSPSGTQAVALHDLLPTWITQKIREGCEKFDQQMRGFLNEQAQFYGVETRTSCPLRIRRDKETLQSVSHPGLYPCGEGAGYAGGITSAACDGIRVAEKIVEQVIK
ncbi:MAG: hypothetical protein C5B49_11935, partial [Bdellovibrio sp.]